MYLDIKHCFQLETPRPLNQSTFTANATHVLERSIDRLSLRHQRPQRPTISSPNSVPQLARKIWKQNVSPKDSIASSTTTASTRQTHKIATLAPRTQSPRMVIKSAPTAPPSSEPKIRQEKQESTNRTNSRRVTKGSQLRSAIARDDPADETTESE